MRHTCRYELSLSVQFCQSAPLSLTFLSKYKKTGDVLRHTVNGNKGKGNEPLTFQDQIHKVFENCAFGLQTRNVPFLHYFHPRITF